MQLYGRSRSVGKAGAFRSLAAAVALLPASSLLRLSPVQAQPAGRLSSLCGVIDGKLPSAPGSHTRYIYQEIIYDAAGVIAADSSETVAEKVRRAWDRDVAQIIG